MSVAGGGPPRLSYIPTPAEIVSRNFEITVLKNGGESGCTALQGQLGGDYPTEQLPGFGSNWMERMPSNRMLSEQGRTAVSRYRWGMMQSSLSKVKRMKEQNMYHQITIKL